MFLFKTKLTTALGAAFAAVLTFGTVSPTEAAPPEGLRWIDTVQRTSPRPSQSSRVGPVVSYPQYSSSSPVTMTPAVATPTSTPAAISVRGPDGIVRTYPVEGPVVQQNAPAFVSVREADGIVRTYPVVDSTPATPTVTSTPAAPVVTPPCR